MSPPEIQIIETKCVNCIAFGSGLKNAGGKNEGNLHYVIENKWIKNVRNKPLHYVIEK
jgi:hypothetical protein